MLSRPLAGTFHVDLAADLAVKDLSPDEVAALAHRPFLQAEDIGLPEECLQRCYATAIGFPSARAKQIDRLTIDPRVMAISGIATTSGNGFVSIHFDKKQGAVEGSGHVTPADPIGMSGGALFGFPLEGFNVRAGAPARLVGIATHWRRNNRRIEGADIDALRRLLEDRVPDDAS